MQTALTAYQEAAFVEAPAEAGTSELLVGPLLDRALRAALPDAPTEIAAPLAPVEAQVTAASTALAGLGLDDGARRTLADAAQSALDSGDAADGATLHLVLLRTVSEQAGRDAVIAAGRGLADDASVDAAIAIDLRTVPDDVAGPAGYSCLTD